MNRGRRLCGLAGRLALPFVLWGFAFSTAQVPAKIDAGSPEALNEVRLLLSAGESEKAAERLAVLRSRRPNDVEVMAWRVRALLAGSGWREALAEARGFHEKFPDEPRLRSVFGEALFRHGRLQEAARVLDGLSELAEAPARGLVVLARLRDAEGREKEAIALMQRAVRAAPLDREVLYRAAGTTATREEAAALLERYLKRSEGDSRDRIDSAEGNLRFFRAIGERPIWVSVARPDRAEIPLKRLWNPYTGRTVGYLIQVRLSDKGKPVSLLLDSGSPGLFVIDRIARKRGFEKLVEGTVFGGGGDGRHETTRGFFPTFSVGGLRFRDVLASTARKELDPTGRYHGLVGLSVFNGYRVTLDLEGGRLLLAPSTARELEGSPYWTLSGQMLVPASGSEGREGLFLFDTGASRTLVAQNLVEGLGGARLSEGASVQAFGGVREGARILDGFELTFQGLSSGRTDLRAADLSQRSALGGVEISGFLGLDLLAGARIELDTAHRRVAASAPVKR